jgi:raffinose/stachyose/melibiose transport system permease protein
VSRRLGAAGTLAFLGVMLVVFIFPLVLALVNSFKSLPQIVLSPLSLPFPLNVTNYVKAFQAMKYPQAFANTAFISITSVLILCVFSAMAAHLFVRNPWKVNRVVFAAMIASMIIPFQAIMIPLVRIYGSLGLLNSRGLLIYLYFAFGTPMAIFMYHGFIKGVPAELEEASIIDGCGRFRTFFYVVLPLLKAMTSTIIVLDMLWFWNDYLLPFLVLRKASSRTLSLATIYFYGTHQADYGLLLAALVMAAVPLLALYMFVQRYVIRGIVQGALK